MKKRVSQFDLNDNLIATYNSISEAAKKTGFKASGISFVCLGQRPHCGGFKFKYVDGETPIQEEVKYSNFKCYICNIEYTTSRGLASHLQSTHKISTKEYTINYILNSCWPKCKIENCINEPRYNNFLFNKYCKEHSIYAMREGGQIGSRISNKNGIWNKGLTKETDSRVKALAEKLSGENNPFYGKTHNNQTVLKIKSANYLSSKEFYDRIDQRKEDFELLSTYDEYIQQPRARQEFDLKLKCKKCGFIQVKSLSEYEIGRLCKNCFPRGTSKEEQEVLNFVKSSLLLNNNKYTEEDIINGDRQQIKPKELDIFIKPLKFAIEYHGLYWHSEKTETETNSFFEREKRKLSQEKLNLCEQQGIQLFQIFSDEWLEKKNLVKSMILSKIGYSPNKVFARKLKIKELTQNESKTFFENSHLSGNVQAIKTFALVDKKTDEIMCAISFRKSFHKKYSQHIEIARFATKPYYQVIGGFTRLFKHSHQWIKSQGYKQILSYCDLRHGTGKVYEKAGFKLIGLTEDVSYWYTDGIKRYNRFKFRADKNNNKTEQDVAMENNVWKIHGCKNKIFEYDLT